MLFDNISEIEFNKILKMKYIYILIILNLLNNILYIYNFYLKK